MSLLSAKNISWRAAGREIVRELSLAVAPGTLTGILGPNGAGKTTLLRLLAGILAPSNGEIFFQGQNLFLIPPRQRSRLLSLMAQEHGTDLMITAGELVALGRQPYTSRWGRLTTDDRKIVDAALFSAGLQDKSLVPLMHLSGGERQRAFLALALAQQTGLLLLDEPGTFLDMHWQFDLWTRLKTLCQQGKTVVAVMHDLNLAARLCDQVLVLDQGLLLQAGPPALVLTRQFLEKVFRCPLCDPSETEAHLALDWSQLPPR